MIGPPPRAHNAPKTGPGGLDTAPRLVTMTRLARWSGATLGSWIRRYNRSGSSLLSKPGSRPGWVGEAGRDYLRYSAVGIQFAVTIGLFIAAGWFLDHKLGTAPVFLLLGVFLGPPAAFYNLYQAVYGRRDGADDDGSISGGPDGRNE